MMRPGCADIVRTSRSAAVRTFASGLSVAPKSAASVDKSICISVSRGRWDRDNNGGENRTSCLFYSSLTRFILSRPVCWSFYSRVKGSFAFILVCGDGAVMEKNGYCHDHRISVMTREVTSRRRQSGALFESRHEIGTQS